jgi:hypothetical protein
LKIVGVVSDYYEALDIEDIVKVFTIEKRIFNLLSLEKQKNFENVNSNIMIVSTDNVKYAETSNKKISHFKNNEDSVPIFNVRGLI